MGGFGFFEVINHGVSIGTHGKLLESERNEEQAFSYMDTDSTKGKDALSKLYQKTKVND